MDWEVLIPILLFLIPLVISILDKRAKKRKGIPPVKAAPVDSATPFPFGAEGGAVPPRRPSESLTQAQRTQQDVFQGEPPVSPKQEEIQPEGERAITRHDEKKVVEEKPRLEIDKKKLILYSEILKPKFDS